MDMSTLIVIASLSPFFISIVSSESYHSEFHEKLGVAYEFKIHVDAGKEDCYYQFVRGNSSLYVAFQVMRGGDNKAGFAIRDPHGTFLLPYQWSESADHDSNSIAVEGFYQFCIDNTPSRFTAKLVSLYVASFKRDEWESFIGELSGYDVAVGNFTHSLANVDHNIGEMLKSLDQSRRLHSHDLYLLEANNSYVMYWSIVQCVVIIVSSLIQVYFVKKLFLDDSSAKSRPRP